MTHHRRGFTLVELIVVTVLGSVVMLAALQILTTNQRAYTAQSAVISGQQSTRMAIEVLFAELREVSAPGGDILAMSSDSLRVRLMRKFSVVCQTDMAVQPNLTVLDSLGSMSINAAANAFDAGDSVFVFADNNENDDDDDVWIKARVSSVDIAAVCPQNGEGAMLLTFNGQGALFAADSVGIGAPVRSYLEYTFGMTTMAGDPYLARRVGNGDMIPIAGPLRAGTGLEFAYRDADGVVTTVPANVRQIEISVRTGSTVLNSLGEMVSDSISVLVYTRN